jgi:hypothetical protein
MHMTSNSEELRNLLDECDTVAKNALYNAQAHFILADSKERKGRWLLIAPSTISAVCGLLTAVGLPNWLGAFSAVGGLMVSMAAIFGVDKQPTAHRNAACQWTALRHEARALHETYYREIPREQFVAEVRRIDDRYIALCQAFEPTDKESFEAARQQIQSGIHEPDTKKV